MHASLFYFRQKRLDCLSLSLSPSVQILISHRDEYQSNSLPINYHNHSPIWSLFHSKKNYVNDARFLLNIMVISKLYTSKAYLVIAAVFKNGTVI